jgi:hypothetical protein
MEYFEADDTIHLVWLNDILVTYAVFHGEVGPSVLNSFFIGCFELCWVLKAVFILVLLTGWLRARYNSCSYHHASTSDLQPPDHTICTPTPSLYRS